MSSNDGVILLPFLSSSSPLLVLSVSSVCFLFGLFIGQTVILGGKGKRISLTFLSILISTCRCGDVGNHLRSSPLVLYTFKGGPVVKGGGNAFFPRVSSSCLCSVSSLFPSSSVSLSRPFDLLSWEEY